MCVYAVCVCVVCAVGGSKVFALLELLFLVDILSVKSASEAQTRTDTSTHTEEER